MDRKRIKKREIRAKAHYYGKAEDFLKKILRRGSLDWPKKNQIHETQKN